MEMYRILVCDPIHENGIKMLKGAGFHVDIDTSISGETLKRKIVDYDSIVIRSRTKVDAGILEGSKLKVVARAGVGLENVDLKMAEKLGIQVINSPEAPSNAVAELVLGLMLSIARRIPKADANMKNGNWIKGDLTGFELKGKALGVIGFGRIGYALAKKARALEMRVLVYDVIIDELMDSVNEIGAKSVGIDELLSESDFISLHVPLSPQTRNMIDDEKLRLMKPNAYLINAARGGIVDEKALFDAITSGKLGGAALDVYEKESPINDLVRLENVIATPHIGAATLEAQRSNSTIIAAELIKILQNVCANVGSKIHHKAKESENC